jgi:hypothetical protein
MVQLAVLSQSSMPGLFHVYVGFVCALEIEKENKQQTKNNPQQHVKMREGENVRFMESSDEK